LPLQLLQHLRLRLPHLKHQLLQQHQQLKPQPRQQLQLQKSKPSNEHHRTLTLLHEVNGRTIFSFGHFF
jgi:hypothetical protein